MKKVFHYLTYAGLVPFFICTILICLGVQELPLVGRVEKILSVYGLVIASFLSGSHWGQHLYITKKPWDIYLPLLSNIIAITLWLGFLIVSFKIKMAMFVVTFMMLLSVDYHLFKIDLISYNYFYVRCVVSFIVIILLIVSGIVS